MVPPSGDSEDREAAELSEALLTFLWRNLKKPKKVPLAVGWMLVTGMTFIRVGWDPEAGPVRPRTIPIPRPKAPLGADPLNPVDPAMAGMAGTEGADGAAGAEAPDILGMEDVEVAADEQGEPYMKGGQIDWDREPDLEPTGEICWDVVSPLCVRTNPEATSFEDATEMYVGTLWPKNLAAEHFKVRVEDLGNADESAETMALYEDMMSASTAGMPRSWADQGTIWGVSQQDAIGDRILVIEAYFKQSAKHPKGRHWITAGHKKVWPPLTTAGDQADADDARETAEAAADVTSGNATTELTGTASTSSASGPGANTEIPGDHGQPGDVYDNDAFTNGEAPLPFGFWPPLVPILDTPIPGQPTALGVVPQVVSLNEQLNTLDGKIAEKHVMDSMGGIWFASPEDKGMNITSEPAQVIYSKAMGRRGQAFAPFQAAMHPLPEPVYRERDVVNQKVIMVSGLSGLDLSQQPTGVTAGRAFLVMQETSDSVLQPTLFALEAGLEECGNRELIIAQQKYRETRTIAIKGDDGKWLYRSFRGADLRNGHDVRVQVGSSFPWSKAAQWDSRMQFLTAVPGLFTDMATGKVDEAKLAKFLDTGTPGLGAFETDENPDLIEIQREHAMFEAFDPSRDDGHQVPQIAFWQNHAVHLQEHFNFMKTSFARFSRWTPEAQEAFKEHMRLTMMAVQEVANGLIGGGASAQHGGQPGAQGADAGAGAGGADAGPPGEAAPGGRPPLAVMPGGAAGGAGAGGGGGGTPAPGNSPMRLQRGDMKAAQS